MREFYLKTISLHVNRSLDDLASFATEKQILRHMRSMPPPGRGAVAAAAAGTEEQRRPLRPIVITRDKVQKEVEMENTKREMMSIKTSLARNQQFLMELKGEMMEAKNRTFAGVLSMNDLL